MTVGNHNFVKSKVIIPNCQIHSRCVFANGKNAMYPTVKAFTHFRYGKKEKIFQNKLQNNIYKLD